MECIVCQDEIRKIENYVIEQMGIPSLVLMEKAAQGICDCICERCGTDDKKQDVLIMVGTGNNGADGLALARMLSLVSMRKEKEKQFSVTVLMSQKSHHRSEEFSKQLQWLSFYDVEIISEFPDKFYDIYVDGLFGFGLNREIEGEYLSWIQRVNGKPGFKIAIDLPSGIHTDTGRVLGEAFLSDLTVTFSYIKPGHIFFPGCNYCGEVILKTLDFPEKIENKLLPVSRYITLAAEEVRLPERKKDGHKGTFGKVLVIGGFEDMPGAAVMSLRAALHTGCGMIRVCSQQKNRDLILSMVPEAQFTSVDELENSLEWPDVVVIGPGLGTGKEAQKSLRILWKKGKAKRIICDADALNLLSDKCNDLWEKSDCMREKEVILTPHMGELTRLLGTSVKDLKDPAEGFSSDFVEKYPVVLVKKDARTMVYSKGESIYVNQTGNSGMGTGGSGDVLTGILAGLLAQNRENTYNTVCLSVCLHGMAGDLAAKKHSEYSVSAGNIIEEIESVIEVISDCVKSKE